MNAMYEIICRHIISIDKSIPYLKEIDFSTETKHLQTKRWGGKSSGGLEEHCDSHWSATGSEVNSYEWDIWGMSGGYLGDIFGGILRIPVENLTLAAPG